MLPPRFSLRPSPPKNSIWKAPAVTPFTLANDKSQHHTSSYLHRSHTLWTGYIVSHIVDILLSQGYQVHRTACVSSKIGTKVAQSTLGVKIPWVSIRTGGGRRYRAFDDAVKCSYYFFFQYFYSNWRHSRLYRTLSSYLTYFHSIDPNFIVHCRKSILLAKLLERNVLLSIMTNLISRLQPCTWIYKILLSHINGGGRTRWCLLYGMDINYTGDQPVFLNESNKDDRVVLHRYGCTPSGQDPVHHVFLNHEVRHSILSTPSLSGYITVRVRRLDWRCRGGALIPVWLGISFRATAFLSLSSSSSECGR